MVHKRYLPALLCALVMVCPAAARASPGVQWLGDLGGGGFYSRASGISADGRVIVGGSSSAVSGEGRQEAFVWTQAGGMQVLGGTTVNSWATAVAADGSVVVGATETPAGQRPFRWTASGGMQDLGMLPSVGNGPFAYAQAVSPDGSIVAGLSGSELGWQAFAWTAGGGITSLGGQWSQASGISSGGMMVGSTLVSRPWSTQAFTWTAGEGMQTIGFARSGDTDSAATAVTADGAYLIGASGIGTNNDFRPFRWQAGVGFELLGDVNAKSLATSSDGSTIVGVRYAAGGNEAFIWRSRRGMVDLNQYLASRFGWDMQQWQLSEATAISADGRCIVGNGTGPNGAAEAFLITLPHPADATMDGFVNVDDLGVLASNYDAGGVPGTGGLPWGQADFNGDGVVNMDDLGILASNYGWSEAAQAGGAVPEPATLMLLLPALIRILTRRTSYIVCRSGC